MLMLIIDVLTFVVGFVILTLVPGLSLSFAIFPKKDELDVVERIVASVLLSISVIPLMIYYSNKLLKIPITIWSNLLYILIVTGISWGILYYRVKFKGRRRK